MGHGFGCGNGSCIVSGISAMLFVCFVLSVLWLSSLRGVRSCCGHHEFGSRSGLLGLFVFSFCLV